MLIAYLAIFPIVGGLAFDLCRDSEHWPWSCFPMYSYPDHSQHFDDYRLYGVPVAQPSSEMPLCCDSRYIQPFDNSRLAGALGAAVHKPGLHDGLVDCLVRYERLRRAGRHNGPPLSAVRLYRCFWTLDPTGKNVDAPDRKELIDEAEFRDNTKP